MALRYVEITHAEGGWKGNWYKVGERYVVRQDPRWPEVARQRWLTVDPRDPWGGINDADCRRVRGLVAFLHIVAFILTRAQGGPEHG